MAAARGGWCRRVRGQRRFYGGRFALFRRHEWTTGCGVCVFENCGYWTCCATGRVFCAERISILVTWNTSRRADLSVLRRA